MNPNTTLATNGTGDTTFNEKYVSSDRTMTPQRMPILSPSPHRPSSLSRVSPTRSNDFSYDTHSRETSSGSSTPGLQPKDVYDSTLPWWRAAIRRKLVQRVEKESIALAKMQNMIRTPFLDAYFVYTSSLGTHTFFMTVLPALFFFGYEDLGRGLLFVLALGIYASSFVKDLICSPRPFSPPVTRLTIGSHHLEYGFPSTHSTNSVSIALFFFSHAHRLASTAVPSISVTTYWICVVCLTFYAFSIVFGRLYTAMHSFTDCIMGVLLGAAIWALQLVCNQWFEAWIASTSWEVPLIIIPLALVLVNQHPQPVDDCPCFEDAIAIISVLMGSMLSRWHAVRWGFDEGFLTGKMPGSDWTGWEDVGLWSAFASWKMVFGILTIFTWRIIAKSTLHLVLPPTFRFLAQIFTLPNRRFYTPATDYKNVPSEFGHGGLLRPIPSVLDLPGELEVNEEVEFSGRGRLRRVDKKTNGVANGYGSGEKRGENWELEKNGYVNGKDGEAVKHYDADVLTKVIVYCGIAVLACEVLPVLFEVLGWGVKSWD